jgi:hypothetical protein
VGVALLGRPLNSRYCHDHLPMACSSTPHLYPKVCCFLFQKVTKINLKDRFFIKENLKEMKRTSLRFQSYSQKELNSVHNQ